MSEALAEKDRATARRRAARFDSEALLSATGADSIGTLWSQLASRPWASWLPRSESDRTSLPVPQQQEILHQAELALNRTVDLLGSGPIALGQSIDWSLDYRTGSRWPAGYARRLNVLDLGRPSDVKFPWELSRMQWLIPVGQAYLLTGDERYAIGVRRIIEEWIDANPYAYTVNWAVTMEVAIRTMTLTWLFHTLHDSESWADRDYQLRFLRTLYLHGEFISRNLERSDINGNHYTADAAGLVFAGLFFGDGEAPHEWQRDGWKILETEIEKQVYPDGVDFEMSTAYQRLVTELFLYPALYLERSGFDVPDRYKNRVVAMARFVAAYSRPDGSIPLWGDADNGRALPFGGQALNDHRYLLSLVVRAWNPPDLRELISGPSDECDWWFGPRESAPESSGAEIGSQAFPDGGVYIMRTLDDHIFIDCGPIGLGGRGGHGHNDCLSLEVVLSRARLIVDPGTYVYTSSVEWRNRFRSTAFHNTPAIDRAEQNRLVRPEFLWLLENDARPSVNVWQADPERDIFRGSHSGYERLAAPVRPIRTITLDRGRHTVVVKDEFRGEGLHDVTVPYHLAPEVDVQLIEKHSFVLRVGDKRFLMTWHSEVDWTATKEQSWVSESYGAKVPTWAIVFHHEGPLVPLEVVVTPERATRLDEDRISWSAVS